MIPKPLKNAYQSFQTAQTAKQAMHEAKRAAAQGFHQGNLNELGSTTQAIDHVLQNTDTNKVLHKHGNRNLRITEHAPSAWSRFKSEVSVKTTQLHARDAIAKMATEHLRLAGDDAQLGQLANEVLDALGGDKAAVVTGDLRRAVHDLHLYAQARMNASAPRTGG